MSLYDKVQIFVTHRAVDLFVERENKTRGGEFDLVGARAIGTRQPLRI